MHPVRPGPLFLFLLLSLPTLADDTPYLVRDLPGVTGRDSIDTSAPSVWTTIGNTSWFVAQTTAGRMEIFRTDGTPAGTLQVTHGTGSPDPGTGGFLGVVNGKLVYAGFDAVYALDPADGKPVRLAPVQAVGRGTTRGGTLYFGAAVTGLGWEPWRTDGTPEGTAPIDFLPGQPGSLDSSPHLGLVPAGQSFVFLGTTAQGRGLYGTDGADASPVLLLPQTDMEFFNDIHTFYVLGDRVLFFRRGTTERPNALWATDGTAAGTGEIAQVSSFSPLVTLGGELLFGDGSSSIWATDGTAAGTRRTDIPGDSFMHAGAVVGEDFYFFAGLGPETLYVTRGTAATTRAIMEVDHGAFHTLGEGFALDGRFFFRHDDGVHGIELWSTDGTTAELVADIHPGPHRGLDTAMSPSVRPDGTVLFTASTPGIGREPWITDGTPAGTRLLANIAAEDSVHGSSPHSLRASGGRLFFIAEIVEEEDAVGVSDGTRAGTSAISIPGRSSTIFSTAAAAGRYFFMVGTADPFGLYASDGTVAGTVGLYPQTATPHPLPNGVVFVDHEDEDHSVWFSDGTVAGTRRLPGIDPGSFTIPQILPAGDLAWITTDDRLWRTDGTDAGTLEIVPAEPRTRAILDAIAAGSTYFLFEAGSKLWRSDGTSAGTTLVKAFGTGSTSFAGAVGGVVYFSVQGALHRSDGTEAGTFALPAPAPSLCRGVDLGGTLLFSPLRSGTTIQLWRSDGTAAGTAMVTAFPAPRPPVASCTNFVVRGGRAYFGGWDAEHGWEPWVTDGTAAGTHMVADVYPGTRSSSPGEFTVAGERVFFSADSPGNGRELWAIGGNPGLARRRSVRP